MAIEPLAWKERPSLIEHILPAQKVSAEAQKERKAGAGQTLTALGSYWKGRKPLILVKACVLGALLPATGDPEKDLSIFEKLMAIDDEAFLCRGLKPSPLAVFQRLRELGSIRETDAERLFVIRRKKAKSGKSVWQEESFTLKKAQEAVWGKETKLDWSLDIDNNQRRYWELRWVQSFDYLERMSMSDRPEQIKQEELFASVWEQVNDHLGTSANSIADLVAQIGVLRFGRRPRVGDPFSGGGSIPFEAARLGCDVYASDLNPVACLLTWGALNIVGSDATTRKEIQARQKAIAKSVEREISALGIEHDSDGNRAKAYLYCLEARCPQTGWMVPLVGTWVVSVSRKIVSRMMPLHNSKRFRIDIVAGVSDAELEAAKRGTVHDGELVYELDGEIYRTPIKTLRGDYRLTNGTVGNRLRHWDKSDFMPRPDDIFQERLYAIQWIAKETLYNSRQETFFAAVTEDDLEREKKVEDIVRKNLTKWQEEGLVPDMPIEPGNETTRLGRERGWTYWHHLFAPRNLINLALIFAEAKKQPGTLTLLHEAVNFSSRLCRWTSSGKRIAKDGSGKQIGGANDNPSDVFSNQALNTMYNYAFRSFYFLGNDFNLPKSAEFTTKTNLSLKCVNAKEIEEDSEIFITDPPYADAVRYEEITEFFIAWLRKNPPEAFKDWVWDSRRSLAIKGSGEDFRRSMIDAYQAMTKHMPDNGLQVVMFTHQDASIWADMTSIVWGAGLKVTAAWYIATETTSELKKGGYVQGTVLLVLRKRLTDEATYRDELVEEVREEVARQIKTMVGLNQKTKGHGRTENLFEDADLQMAGYAAVLRVLTGYRRIDGQDMVVEALRPRQKGERDIVKEIIDYAVTIANEHLVPEGIPVNVWEQCSGEERFYLKMLEMETFGLKKLDNYQNFAKAFRVADYGSLMGSMKANDARLKNAIDFKKAGFEDNFGKSPVRAILFALYELQREIDSDEVMAHLRDLIPAYLTHREALIAFCQFIALRRERTFPDEAGAARVLLTRIKNERLGG
ncbi:anti-phage-associated DUF1156 domain-containing protein [Nostoc punctiforme UO1]|uniref:anti-phage-associated DUF1156 domain-containing protein n=1 Tax=Nostoc punctiforme TaxID=272131 RepID=UPI0030B540C6